ncbi:MAG: cytochrome c [Betaproteobacteria bacterium]
MRSPSILAGAALAAAFATALTGCATAPSATSAGAKSDVRLGKPISAADLAAWDIDIRTSDGRGLPPGRGTVAEGKAVYEAQCIACHGADAKGGPVYGAMVGGVGSFKTGTRVVTPGSMYPYAPILFDYIRRAMPMDRPQSMSANEVYAVSGYILNLNGLVPADAVMDANSLPKVMMPNRDGFIVDDRPDTKAKRCMQNCL